MRRILSLVTIFWVVAGFLVPVDAAQPFKAPAVFDFNGSTMALKLEFDLGRLGTHELKINPNPAPVTGFIDIETVSSLTGVCRGRLRDFSATTQAGIEKMGVNLDFTVTATLNADPLDGVFLWSKDKAVFYPDNLILTLDFGGEKWDIPLSGIPLPAQYRNGVLTLNVEVEQSGKYEGYDYDAVIGLHLVGVLKSQAPGNGNITIELELDKNSYKPGDRLKLRAALDNSGGARKVDIYVAFFDPEGNYFFGPDYTSRMTPLITVDLDAYEHSSLTEILNVLLPAHTPPIAAAEASSFCAVVTAAGSTAPISNLACADFTYDFTPANPDPYDGEWHGSGGSSVVGGECPALAEVHMTIVKSQISGVADEVDMIDADGYRMTGTIDTEGKVTDGVLLEEFMNSWIPVGSFTCTFSGSSCTGTWIDEYGCYGSFSLARMNEAE